jgi:hypothetical protein
MGGSGHTGASNTGVSRYHALSVLPVMRNQCKFLSKEPLISDTRRKSASVFSSLKGLHTLVLLT